MSVQKGPDHFVGFVMLQPILQWGNITSFLPQPDNALIWLKVAESENYKHKQVSSMGKGNKNPENEAAQVKSLFSNFLKFYLFAIAYLPTLLPTTQLFFCFFFAFPEHFFFFVAVSIFQFQSEILKLYKLTRRRKKKQHRILSLK